MADPVLTPKKIWKIRFWRFRANERWCGCDFRMPGYAQVMRSWGPTPQKAEQGMLGTLDHEFGRGEYVCEFAGDKAFTREPEAP